MSFQVIAIDGPTGVGKSTLALQLAQSMKFLYVDTGAMFRCLAWKWDQEGQPQSVEKLEYLGVHTSIEFRETGRVWCDGVELSNQIRTEKVSALASQLSQFPSIRKSLKNQQRTLVSEVRKQALFSGAVLEGRDIGTVVFPDAELKFFLEATPEIRAMRRYEQLKHDDPEISYESILESLQERDHRDRNRAIAPLKAADDATILDTSELSCEEVLQELIHYSSK